MKPQRKEDITPTDIATAVAHRAVAEHPDIAIAVLVVRRVGEVREVEGGAQSMRLLGGNSLLYEEGYEQLLLGLEQTVEHLANTIRSHIALHGLRAEIVTDLSSEPARSTRLDS